MRNGRLVAACKYLRTNLMFFVILAAVCSPLFFASGCVLKRKEDRKRQEEARRQTDGKSERKGERGS